jgi:hypothetical protein
LSEFADGQAHVSLLQGWAVANRAWGAKQLVMWSIAGVCLVSATWFLAFVPLPSLPVAGHGFWSMLWVERLWIVGYLFPGAIGLTLTFWAGGKFRRGVLDDRWSETELQRARAFLWGSAWKIAGFCLLILCAVLLLLHTHSGAKASLYLLVLPFVRAQFLREQVTPRRPGNKGLADWRSFKPIRSEHWGGGNV